jgi:sensor histidine kinase regulating citrate/malate metabolism
MNLKFSSKIMTLVTVSVILSVSLTSVMFYNILQEQIVNDKIERSASIANIVSNQLTNAVYFSDLSEMNSVIAHLVEQDEFESVKILDNDGNILASSNIETSQSLSAFEDKAIKTKNISKNFQNYVLSMAYPIETSERIGTLVIVGHLDELENILNELLLLFLIIGIFVSIVTSGIAMIFSKSLTTPILKIQKRSFQHLRRTRQHRKDYSNIVLTNGLLFKARLKMAYI